jgi:hypothetical protein
MARAMAMPEGSTRTTEMPTRAVLSASYISRVASTHGLTDERSARGRTKGHDTLFCLF